MTVAIKIENLSKQYRLGLVSTRTLSHDLNRWWQTTIRGKEDPYLKIGEVNDRATRGEGEYVWALRDINMEVEQGEVLGIIGKNGAGKSTLLKILSKVTAPTTGTIKTKGRIASLLEVGTGFHYEMTGRENIYMNGAIMGMSKAEITRKLDEIIDFAGVERYIDTPVKRYSSGMIVRLGFAVAAHLEPEILVVDEVLAVGDAEFQKKAIGKMQDISHGEGRTVLFVSHNLSAIETLCYKGIVLENGITIYNGIASNAIRSYLQSTHRGVKFDSKIIDGITYFNPGIKINSILINDSDSSLVKLNQKQPVLNIVIEGESFSKRNISLGLTLFDQRDVKLAIYSPGHMKGVNHKLKKGYFKIEDQIHFPKNINKGEYRLDIGLHEANIEMYIEINNHIKLISSGIVGKTGLEFDYNSSGFLVLD